VNVIGVIPARYGSTRLPGKPLQMICGKPLLQWVLEGVKSSQLISEFVVATDHVEIVKLAQNCGVAAVMTDPDLPSGSDRVWAATKDSKAEIILNIQGDEPLIRGRMLDRLVECFTDQSVEMATLGRKMTSVDLESPNTAKIVLNCRGEALYFSRFAIPYSRDNAQQFSQLDASVKHIGIYGYRKEFLKKFCEQKPVALELAEGLEQLRALYLGAKIKVALVEEDSWGVDTPDDVKRIERIIKLRD
jgi:3-deoxy-manno-octulosonate cytidylyltransferase (CMP-KDO synthetase)